MNFAVSGTTVKKRVENTPRLSLLALLLMGKATIHGNVN